MNPDDLRNWLSSTAADLRSKKVLPLLALLLAAAIAIPIVLSKSGKAAALTPIPPAPRVTVPTVGTTTTRHHEASQNYLTDPAHNPFATTTTPTSTTGASSAKTSTTSSATSAGASGRGRQTGSGRASTVTLTTPSRTTTVSKTTTVPAKSQPYSNYEAEVSVFQTGSGSTAPTVFHNLSRDQPLPNDDTAFAVYLGVRRDKTTAVFVLPDDATVSGDGSCAPRASGCTFLMLQPGQSVKVSVQSADEVSATYTLRYIKVQKVSSSASTVSVDQTGAAEVEQASAYVPQLKTIKYATYSGLLTIILGTPVPANS